jgi:hypothetical protein
MFVQASGLQLKIKGPYTNNIGFVESTSTLQTHEIEFWVLVILPNTNIPFLGLQPCNPFCLARKPKAKVVTYSFLFCLFFVLFLFAVLFYLSVDIILLLAMTLWIFWE